MNNQKRTNFVNLVSILRNSNLIKKKESDLFIEKSFVNHIKIMDDFINDPKYRKKENLLHILFFSVELAQMNG